MKIKIEIDPETLFLVHRLILDKCQTIQARNSKKSILNELFEVFSRKCIAYTAAPNGKKRTLNLWYHQAYAVLEIAKEDHPSYGYFERNKLDQLKNQLYQKLL